MKDMEAWRKKNTRQVLSSKPPQQAETQLSGSKNPNFSRQHKQQNCQRNAEQQTRVRSMAQPPSQINALLLCSTEKQHSSFYQTCQPLMGRATATSAWWLGLGLLQTQRANHSRQIPHAKYINDIKKSAIFRPWISNLISSGSASGTWSWKNLFFGKRGKIRVLETAVRPQERRQHLSANDR